MPLMTVELAVRNLHILEALVCLLCFAVSLAA